MEKAEFWASTHSTAPRVRLGGQACQDQGPLCLRDLTHPLHPELSNISFSSNPKALHGHPLDKVSGSHWVGGSQARVQSEACQAWWAQDPSLSPASFSLACQGPPQPTPASQGRGQNGSRQVQQPQPLEPPLKKPWGQG